MKKIFNVMLTVAAFTVIFGFSGCKITATPVPEANYKITYVSAENQSLLPSSKTVKEGYKLTAEDLPNLEVGLDTEAVEDDVYCNWDKEIGDVVSGDITITGTWEDIVCLNYDPSVNTFLYQVLGLSSVPYDLINADSREIYFVKEHTPETYEKTHGCANHTNPDYFTASYGVKDGKAEIYISGNGHRIYAPSDSSKMFNGFSDFAKIEIGNLYTSKVTNMSYMFCDCSIITDLDVSHFNTSNVEDMSFVFKNCSAVTGLDLSNWDTVNVTTMSSMFLGCEKLETVNLSSFNTEKVTNLRAIFQDCKALTELDISSFDTSNVLWKSMGGCGLSIFVGCSSLTTIYASDKFTSTAPNLAIFDGCTSLIGGAGTKYADGETSDPDNYKTAAYARIDGGEANPGYFTAK